MYRGEKEWGWNGRFEGGGDGEVKYEPLPLKDIEKEIDCGCEAFWQRWWNAKELDMPKIVSELSFCLIDPLLETRKEEDRELLKRALYGAFYREINQYFIDAVNFGKLLMLREIRQYIKSAVRGLIRELESRIKELDRYEDMGFTKQFCANRRDEIKTYVIPLIKKWFADVVEGEE